MGIKIPKTNNFVIDDVFNIVLKKRKKEEKKKSKKESKLNESPDTTSKKGDERKHGKSKYAITEVEKIVVGVVED